VTYDRDCTDEDETTERIRKAIPGIMLPPVFLRDVMGWTSEELEETRHREWMDLEGTEVQAPGESPTQYAPHGVREHRISERLGSDDAQ